MEIFFFHLLWRRSGGTALNVFWGLERSVQKTLWCGAISVFHPVDFLVWETLVETRIKTQF